MVKAAWAGFRVLRVVTLGMSSLAGCACSDDAGGEASGSGGVAAGAGGAVANGTAGGGGREGSAGAAGGAVANGAAGEAGRDGSAGAAGGAALDVFEVFERARTAMRASPDHLPARADALVERGSHLPSWH